MGRGPAGPHVARPHRLQDAPRRGPTPPDAERGDVVILNPPAGEAGEELMSIKRVLAVGGDEIALRRDGMVLVNGEVVDEPYLAPGEFTVNVPTQEVPPGHVFVMGDNRDHSFDSRTIGPVPADDVLAIVLS